SKGESMTSTNGAVNGHDPALIPLQGSAKRKKVHLSQQQAKALLEQLQVPFNPLIIQWKVVETRKVFGKFRGRIIPYADKLAYHERLNQLVTSVGWAQNVSVHTSPIAPRDKGRTASAKLVVTCHLTIHVLGSHSSTGEAWTVDD